MAKEIVRSWLKGTALAGDFGQPLERASTAKFVFRLGTNVPRSHPLNIHAQRAADTIRRETNGEFDLQLFPNNELGGDSKMFAQLRSGELQCFALSGVNVLSGLVPTAAIYGVGFAFPNYEAVWRALDGKLGLYLRSEIEKAGFVVMEKIWDNGFRQITTSGKPIAEPADLHGLKIRVPISALWTSLFQSLGAAPGGIDFADAYPALKAKVFDAQENPLVIISAARLYEVQSCCSMTGHMWDGWWFLVNRNAWRRLPQAMQQLIAQKLDAAALAQRRDVANFNARLRKDLASRGLVFNDVDATPFREALSGSGYYVQWKKKFGEEAWSLLQEVTGTLA
jgi:tripartite ATP-independent transporter DctP family solute receptor